jgi:ADP-heptose:LPS heptosyltransferase
MYPAARNILIINFSGIGNGIWILPMLKRLEETAPNCHYFHVHNPVFESHDFISWLGLKNFLGTVPTNWRRFDPQDWGQIKEFFARHSIDLVVNLRNEGPLRDLGYFNFKVEMARSGVEFWELDHENLAGRRASNHLLLDQLSLLTSHGMDMASFNRLWLRDYIASRSDRHPRGRQIGFFTGASQNVKTWPADHWVALGRMLLDRTDYGLIVYAGRLEHELALAQAVAGQLQIARPSQCTLVKDQMLESLCSHLSGLELVVSNDTSCVHMAAALDVPTVGLYFSTDSDIWGGMNEKFLPVQSQTGLSCPSFKRDAGNCNFYYGGCPGPCKEEVTPERVYQAIAHLLMSVNASVVVPVAVTAAIEGN